MSVFSSQLTTRGVLHVCAWKRKRDAALEFEGDNASAEQKVMGLKKKKKRWQEGRECAKNEAQNSACSLSGGKGEEEDNERNH